MSDYLVDTSPMGKMRLSNMVFWCVLSPNERPLYFTIKRKMKDSCLAFEEKYDVDWEDAVKDGYRAMKCWANGIDNTEKSLQNVGDWIAEDEPHIPRYVKDLQSKSQE
jgi:hypothetical protein